MPVGQQPRRKYVEGIVPVVLVVICLSIARFVGSLTWVAIAFATTLAIYIWRSYDPRILIGASVLLLLGCALMAAAGRDDYAARTGNWSYSFLALGLLGLVVERVMGRNPH